MKHIKRFNESNVNESFKTKAKKLIDDTKKLKDDYPEKKYNKILELEKRKGSGCSLWLFSSSAASTPKYLDVLFKTYIYFLLYML